MPLLSDLATQLPRGVTLENPAETSSVPELTGITADSREARPGMVFAAVRGVQRDGVEYIAEAVAAGASAVLTRQGVAVPAGVPHLIAEKDRKALAKLAALFYAPQPRYAVAVTGTDGKTSTVDFFRQLLEGLEEKAASIGTLGVRGKKFKLTDFPAINTSPDPVLLHRALQQLADQECEYVALEASSHGLDQYRLDGVKFAAAAFTNIARDHLDYHVTEANYFKAKMRLFGKLLPRGKRAVIYRKHSRYDEVMKICKLRKLEVVSYGYEGDLRIEKLRPLPEGMEVRLSLHGRKVEAMLELTGEFQLLNILAAMGLAEGCGKEMFSLVPMLGKLQPVRGRLEKAGVTPSGAAVYVDYAHTPAALANVLKILRVHCQGKLAVVFGCGGDRDPGKRPQMGAVAGELADRVYVTDDNPRSEDPAVIRRQVIEGVAEAGSAAAREIGDRRAAIAAALEEAGTGDIVVIAGKGHETTQTVGAEVLPFDDAQVVREWLRGKENDAAALAV